MDKYGEDDDVMIIDSACDQSMIHSSACLVLSHTSVSFHVDGAMSGMVSQAPLSVKNVAVLVVDPYSSQKVVAIINQALYVDDDTHGESLLQPHQCRQFGTAIDDCAKHHLGVNGEPGGARHCC